MKEVSLKSISGKYCPRFGNIAVELGYITETQLKKAICLQVEENLCGKQHRLLGAILFDLKYMTSEQIDDVLNILFEQEVPE